MATTPYMGLILPVVSTTIGPDWATYLNTALTSVDSHNHAPGKGLQVTVAGININADLSFASFNATTLRSIRLNTQTAVLALATDVGCIYQVNGDLYYNNGAGTSIKITSGTSINATAVGGIGGDYVTSGASVFYTSATKLFSFQSITTPAGSIVWSNLGTGPLVIHDTAAGVVNAITLKSPAALAASYNATLPTALPASTLPITMTNAGVMATQQLVNAQQNFGTPSAATDVVIKSAMDANGPGNKAWAILTLGGAGAVTVTAGYNIASAGYSTILLTVVFTNAPPSANYAVLATSNTAGLAATAAYIGAIPGATSFDLTQITPTPTNVNWASGAIIYVSAIW